MPNQLKDYSEKLLKSLNFFKHIFKVSPENNWMLILLIFIILNFFLLGGSVLKLYDISSGDFLLEADDSIKPNNRTINRTILNDTLSVFRIKNENYLDLKSSNPNFIDPSI